MKLAARYEDFKSQRRKEDSSISCHELVVRVRRSECQRFLKHYVLCLPLLMLNDENRFVVGISQDFALSMFDPEPSESDSGLPASRSATRLR
jgi:hypothetical protein